MDQNSRRSFFKHFAALTGAVVIAPALLSSFAQAEEKRRAKKDAGGDGGLSLVDPTKGMAASLHYAHTQADVKDASLKIERNGVPFEKQNCASCMLYVAAGKKGNDEVGKCQVINDGVVKATGFCASWQKKA